EGSTVAARGPAPTPVDPTVLRIPVPDAIENADTLLLPWFTTYRCRPEGSVATDCGFVLGANKGNGEPVIPVRFPIVLLIVNADTLLVPLFPTNTNRLRGSADNATGPVPGATENGEPTPTSSV